MNNRFRHVELFAGCGGMSLGLDAAGFDLVFANELSPMAANTFAHNILKEDLDNLANAGKGSNKVLWIKSKYDKDSLKKRLKENPYEFSIGKFSDLDSNSNLQGKLIVGDIKSLVDYFNKNPAQVRLLHKTGVDLLSGGPPCQSFSMAGMRVKDDHKNKLPFWFAQMANSLKPKFVVLENVKGIINPFKEGDRKFYAHFEVAKEFARFGYVPLCSLLNAKYFGIPQSRPRFIMIGIREDVAKKCLQLRTFNESSRNAIATAMRFFSLVNTKNGEGKSSDLHVKELTVFDIERSEHLHYFNGHLLPRPLKIDKFTTTQDALDGLLELENGDFIDEVSDKYGSLLMRQFNLKTPGGIICNHEFRKHSPMVKARFRAYQILNTLKGDKADIGRVFFGDKADTKSIDYAYSVISHQKFYFPDEDRLKRLRDSNEFRKYLRILKTKKHSQRALISSEPSPAQLTIPDDVCHYDSSQLRTLSVREIARLQSFPDNFVFKSKVTTGGRSRKHEVPQYTQVGNAVPPLLALSIGRALRKVLSELDEMKLM